MSSLSKLKKRTGRLNIKQCDDPFTRLPSCLVTKILSCLPTKEAVATSVLSTKWKRSWMSITNLDFDDRLDAFSYEADKDAQTIRKFSNFVTRVLLLRERSCLQRVRLSCYVDYDNSLVNAWLSAIIECNAQELDISVSFPREHPGLLLCSDIFHCNTLVDLKLSTSSLMSMPNSACLPALRTLNLAGFIINDVASFTSLLSGCPILEELRLCWCVGAGSDIRVTNISSQVLKKLIIENFNGDELENDYQIVIDTPALEYLDLSACFTIVYVRSQMDNLIKADIKFGYDFAPDSYELYYEALQDLVEGISQVRTLILSRKAILSIRFCDLVLPRFSKLTNLKLEMDRWCFLLKLLENTPCLETLHIRWEKVIPLYQDPQDKDEDDDDDEMEEGPSILSIHDTPPCFLSHLKEIKIENFEYINKGMKVAEYILKNAKVLEKLILHYPPNPAEICLDVAKALLSLPRISAVCKVVVLDL